MSGNNYSVLEKLKELDDRMNRIKVLMDATNMSMEELMGESAIMHVDCMSCPLKTVCDQYRYDESIGCSEVWIKYLKGEIYEEL